MCLAGRQTPRARRTRSQFIFPPSRKAGLKQGAKFRIYFLERDRVRIKPGQRRSYRFSLRLCVPSGAGGDKSTQSRQDAETQSQTQSKWIKVDHTDLKQVFYAEINHPAQTSHFGFNVKVRWSNQSRSVKLNQTESVGQAAGQIVCNHLTMNGLHNNRYLSRSK